MSTPALPADDAPPPWAAGTDTRLHELYPVLNESQLAILCADGVEEHFGDREWLWEVGDRERPLYAVLDGTIEAVRRDVHGDSIVSTFSRGQFTGDTSMMAQRAALLAGRARGQVRAIVV